MKKNKIKLTSEFKTQTTLAIISIVIFVITYLLILSLAIGLTVLCIYGALVLIGIKITFITLALGIGLASLGVLVLIFLLKFFVKSHKVDRSHLYEITRKDEPELFKLIDEIVSKVNTSFPKKIYLSTNVNASVFYDSSFWSMFFPIKKNLQIGMGLINTVTKSELKSILSHEFGHFSQSTMKVGSYVYNVNQVIYNLLYDNESYDNLIQNWANSSGFFSFFVIVAVKIIEGIQWVLRLLYEIVNKSYLGLSREMEFHADEIAANITGFEPLRNSLLRLNLADYSFNYVLNFYEGKIAKNVKSENLYKEQADVLRFLAERNNYTISNNLPDISIEQQTKFDKTKLVIKDQWTSHPSTKDRIERLEKLNVKSEQEDGVLANSIFKDIEATQKMLTNTVFNSVIYTEDPKILQFENFQTEYKSEILNNSFSDIYNGYYDIKNPIPFELEVNNSSNENVTLSELFSDSILDKVYTAISLQNDIESIKQIDSKVIQVKTFVYDGIKYKRNECKKILIRLEDELKQINEKIKENDIQIFLYFKNCEQKQHTSTHLKELYREFFEFDKQFETRYEIYTKLSLELQFVNITTPYKEILSNFKRIEPLETELKEEIKAMFSNKLFKNEITKEIKDNFDLYLSKKWEYFGVTIYNDENLNILYAAMNNYAFLLSRGYFLLKKKLLSYQDGLIIPANKSV